MGGLWASTSWYFHGLWTYTRSAFNEAYKTFDTQALNIDLTGKVYIVTGANSGLGKVVARELGARGATVHMLCRNQAKAEAAASELVAATKRPASHFVIHQVDMSRPAEVRAFAKSFLSTNQKLDCLVNNAGVMAAERVLTPDNLESSFACNVLGTYMLTELLQPVLAKTSGARVVTVTSAGMLTERLDASDPQFAKATRWDGTVAYAKHKRAQVELTHHWAVTYPSVQFFSTHPGWADTPGVRNYMPSFYSMHKTRLRTAEQGADSILWCAAAAAAMQLPNGSFVEDRHVVAEHLTWSGTATKPGDLEKLIGYLNGLVKQDGNGKGASEGSKEQVVVKADQR
jgi:dehydrogenase/reductase SDR family protein 12